MTGKIEKVYTNDLLIPYRKKGKWGFCSLAEKKIVIACQFLNASVFNYISELDKDLAVVEDSTLTRTYQFFIDARGQKGIPLNHKHIWINGFVGYNGRYFAKVARRRLSGDKIGIIDKYGNYTFDCEFDDCGTLMDADGYYEMLLPVERNKRWGIINQSKQIVAPFQFDFIGEFGEEDLAVCSIGVLNHLDFLKQANLGYFSTPGYGFINKNGTITNKNYLYHYAKAFSEGLAAVKKPSTQKQETKEKWGFIDAHFEEITPFAYEDAKSFSNGLAAVKEIEPFGTGKWGFINVLGELIIDYRYDDAYSFQEASFDPSYQLAAVKIGAKWGFIDPEGALAVECKFEEVYSFDHEIAAVRIDKKWGFINSVGEFVITCKYDWIAETQYNSNLFVSFAGRDKKFIINDFLIRISLAGKAGYIDTAGTEYWEN